METLGDPELHPEPHHKIHASIKPASTHQHISSSSGNIRAPGSAVSKTPSQAQSFSIFEKKSAVQ
ncbi:hypothetical protein F2Q69_00013626 [Brassica cretica]|uniref:Uncharacterized protein n=1 Tax=Brassica cretica TaxID=69181 RepID=A0A8S9QKR0_BRACR|nr:hypothetical protein F2Q69_00013626 [Brassica cretica]